MRRAAEIPPGERHALEMAMENFYRHPPAPYYPIADQVGSHYDPQLHPFHCDLVSRVQPGMRVLELGCGTAHLCPSIEKRGAIYTGLDHSSALLSENRRKFPRAHFASIETQARESFDLVASLYTIEHVVNPRAYLERMWQYCKPDGLLAVICPEFIDNECLPPSLFYGKTARRFKEKLRSLDLQDVFAHVVDLKKRAPAWKSEAVRTPPGAFWINLRPRMLHGAPYSIDADAIHLPRLKDLIAWFRERPTEIVTTSRDLPNVRPEVLRFNCYIVARKNGPNSPPSSRA